MKKLIICIITAAVIFALAGCSYSEKEEETTTALKTTAGDSGRAIYYDLTEEDAKAAAFDALKKECENGNYSDIENFEFLSAELMESTDGYMAYNQGYGNSSETENFSGHSYYCVVYKNTSELSDQAYICIDAVTGDLLFSGYMGD